MITFAFLSHHSKELILPMVEKIISYNLNIPIIIIENSQDLTLKKELEEKYKEFVKVYIPSENLGFSKGMNKAVELSETDFIFLNPADVILPLNCIKGLLECVNNFDDFTLLAPTYEDGSVHENYVSNLFSNNNETKKKFYLQEKFSLREVDWIDGTFIVNKKKINTTKIMDENIFIYFETMDMCYNFKKNKHKMYVVDNLKFTHLGGQSHNKKYDFEAHLSRNWHYNWSKFYYFRKNKSYFYALRKFLTIIPKILVKIMIFKIKGHKKEYDLCKAELLGSLNSILLRSSYYRPYLKK